jgi:RimJ/RimL family protein N-acetyltransferase
MNVMFPETARLTFEPWQAADADLFRPIATDPEVMRYITGGTPWSDEEIRLFVDRQMKLYAERGFCRWRLIEKASGDFIGFCGVGLWRDEPDPEIGWWLARHAWGRGLATEAARVALRDAFERVQLDRIVSVAMADNAASIAIMRKLGLTPDIEFEREGFRLVRYAITRAAWAAAGR